MIKRDSIHKDEPQKRNSTHQDGPKRSSLHKRDSKPPPEAMEIDLKSCTSITYDFDRLKYGKFDVRKPTLSELLEWKCLQAKLGFYSRAKTFLGIRVAVSSWTDAYVAVSDDKLYFYKTVDELDRITDFTFELEECLVQDIGESEGRNFVFAVQERKGARVVLAAENRQEYLTFVRAIRRGCSQFLFETIPFFDQKARIVQRSFRRNYHRRRYLKMKKGFTRLQAIYRGQKARKEYRQMYHAVVIVQSFIRMCIAKWARELLKLQGNVQKYQMARTYTFQEIVQTEESYVKDLDTLVNVFLKPMKAFLEAAVKEKGTASDRDFHQASLDSVGAVIQNLQDIRVIHAEFLAKIKKKLDQWNENTEVASVFIELSGRLEVYVPFCTNYEIAKKNIFDASKRNERLRQLLEDVTPAIRQVKKLDLFGFLILPIQRVPRYSLLLSDLLKRTWKNHPDYHSIAEAVLKMQKAGAVLNETRRQDEERKKTETLINKFKEPTAIQELLSRSANAACIHEGPVVSNHTTPTEDDPKKYIKAQLFLFSDQIVLAKKVVDKKINGKSFKIWNNVKFSDAFSIPLHSITEGCSPLPGPEAHDFGFLVTLHGLKVKLFAPSSEAREHWLREINHTIAQYKKNH